MTFFKTKKKVCMIIDSSVAGDLSLLGTIFSHVVILHGLLDLEDEGTTVLRSIRNYSPNNTTPHPGRLESSEFCWIIIIIALKCET